VRRPTIASGAAGTPSDGSHAAETFDGKRSSAFSHTGHVKKRGWSPTCARAGVIVSAIDPNERQRSGEILAVDGHLRGQRRRQGCSNVPGAEQTEHVLECKAVNDKRFNALKQARHREGRAEAHYAQVAQLYMHGLGLTRCLYVATNTNDDELYAERIKYDADVALRMIAKAERIVRCAPGAAEAARRPGREDGVGVPLTVPPSASATRASWRGAIAGRACTPRRSSMGSWHC
jgi:hypothetical protein